MSEFKKILSLCDEKMHKTIEHLKKELTKIRAGKANPSMLDGLKVDYYGSLTILSQVANVITTDSRTINVQPWEKNMLEPIEKIIRESDLGFNPVNNGEFLVINIPALTEERRLKLTKQVKSEVEEAKVVIRNVRKDSNGDAKKLKDNGFSDDMIKGIENDIQKLTDKYILELNKIETEKVKEIMTV